jgi:hypothetical protein
MLALRYWRVMKVGTQALSDQIPEIPVFERRRTATPTPSPISIYRRK